MKTFYFFSSYEVIVLAAFALLFQRYLFKVSWMNSSIEMRNGELFSLFRNEHFQFNLKQPRRNCLKVNTFLQADHFFYRSSFKLLNGYRINTHLLEILLTSLACISFRTYGETLRKYFF